MLARYPTPGGAKTRLIPALGAEGAADLQRAMTERTLAFADRLVERRRVAVELLSTGATAHQMQALYGPRRRVRDQGEGDLGMRLERAFGRAFLFGATRVVAIGVDCPELDDRYLEEALEGLEAADVVLGPAEDGGYVLIGLAAPRPELFQGIDWGSALVFQQTLAKAREANQEVRFLATLRDVDEPADLSAWEQRRPLSDEAR